jgi:hypothetical protein
MPSELSGNHAGGKVESVGRVGGGTSSVTGEGVGLPPGGEALSVLLSLGAF